LDAGVVNTVTLLDAANAPVAAAITLDATRKIVTINPDANLAATTAHAVIYAVEDIYGQHLTGVLTFTTGA
jgi:tRNA(Arg) A34 adenosine deaminase TadA